MLKQPLPLLLAALFALSLAGCSSQSDTQENVQSQPISSTLGTVQRSTPSQSASSAASLSSSVANSRTEESTATPPADAGSSAAASGSSSTPSGSIAAGTDATSASASSADNTDSGGVLTVHFGDNGSPFTMHLYDNDTAAAIASYVGTADWRLPINNFDGYENWESMQFYDLPSRYEIPSNPTLVTAQKAGEVYYSDPNRIVLFYQDATVSADYTKIGYFDATEAFVDAVQSNPVLEGWGNKIVLIKD